MYQKLMISSMTTKFQPKSLSLGGGFNYFLFSPFRELIHFDEHIFQMGWFNHQPVVDFLFF